MTVLKSEETNSNESFDLESLRLRPDVLAAAAPAAESVDRSKRRPRARQAEPFVHMLVRDFEPGVRALKGAKELAVWVFILWQWRMCKPEPVVVTNAGLAALGVDRRAKYLALRKLAAAGLIQIQTERPGNNPRVVPQGVQ